MSAKAAEFRQRLRHGAPLLLDGAVGSELERRGVDVSLPLWSARALLQAPDTLERIHRDYARAGADILTTNTFRTHRRSLRAAGCGDQAAALTTRAVGLARRAAVASPSGLVAGSMAPLEDCYRPDLVPDNAALRSEHGAMAQTLARAGVDLILVETMNTVREARAAATAALATGLPVVVGVVCGRDGRLLSGEDPAAAAAVLADLGADAVVVNCAPTPDLRKALRRLMRGSDLPTGAYGNVGYAHDDIGWVNTDAVGAEAYLRHAAAWLDAGVRIVGSCCGTTPEHTRALRRFLDTPERGG